jgi:4-aminobutyrate aminotransferase-like enzyme
MMTMALTTSKLYYREKYEPLPGSIYTAPFPYVLRSHTPNDPQACVEETFTQIETLFRQFIHPEQVSAFIIEPVQGEGGYVVPPKGFLPRLRELANKHGILLIMDEVQTGFGRTGKMFACEHENVEPDVLLMAKGIAGGMPLAGFVSRRDITEKWPAGRHGSTFGGNPVSCAAALATIEVLQEEKLPERAAKVGAEILSKLKQAAQGQKHIADVRGLGMMIAIEFNDDKGHPCKARAEKFAEHCLEQKLIVLTCGTHGQVVRLIPPLNVSEADVDKALAILEKNMTLK